MGRTAHHDDQEEGEEGAKRKKFDLSVSQVAGAGAATLAAATAASYLNVYGTVIGAAGMAALSTLVSPLLQHWFSRGGEQARQLAGRASGHHGATVVPDAPGAPVAPPPEGISETALLRQVSGTGTPPPSRGEEDADATRTMALPALDGRTRTPADPGATARTPAVGPWRPDTDAPDDHGGSDGGSGGATGGREGGRRRGWRSLVVPATAVFVLAMLVILVFELFTGRSLTSWTQGSEEPSAPTLFGGSTSGPPAGEEELDAPATGDDTPDPSVGGQEEAPGTDQPTEPAPETGAPEDEGTGDGGTEEDAPGGTGGTTEPTVPPEGDGGTQDPGGQAPDPGTGDQGGEEAVPAPPPAVPQSG